MQSPSGQTSFKLSLPNVKSNHHLATLHQQLLSLLYIYEIKSRHVSCCSILTLYLTQYSLFQLQVNFQNIEKITSPHLNGTTPVMPRMWTPQLYQTLITDFTTVQSNEKKYNTFNAKLILQAFSNHQIAQIKINVFH